jgi:membrane protein
MPKTMSHPAEHRDRAVLAKQGAFAESPAQFGLTAWGQILVRIWTNSGRRNIGFLASGVAFYGFLSFVPALGLLVMIVGLVADPAAIFGWMMDVVRIFPPEAAELINVQLANLIKTAGETTWATFLPAAALSLYGASRAAGGMISSLNTIYNEEEQRSFFRLVLVTLGLAIAAIVVGALGLLCALALSLLEVPLEDGQGAGRLLIRGLTWLLAAGLAALTFAGMYRYGPCRHRAKWRWLTAGSLAATTIWLGASLLFGWYASFANYSATYGPLGAVIALMIWFYISAYAVLIGAFVDAEAERQTACDSTIGPDAPLGERGAVVADTSVALHSA